jgi:flagellar protein FlgJ
MSDALFAAKASAAYGQAKAAGPAVAKHMNPVQARKAAQEYEGVFLSQMLQPMFKDLAPVEPFGGGPGDEIWRTMQVDEFGKAIAKSGGIGLSDAIYRQMMKMQEAR